MHELSIAMEVCQMAEDRLGADALPSGPIRNFSTDSDLIVNH